MRFKIGDKFKNGSNTWEVTGVNVTVDSLKKIETIYHLRSQNTQTTIALDEVKLSYCVDPNIYVIPMPGLNAGPITTEIVKPTVDHSGHRVVQNFADGKEFRFCRDCRIEVLLGKSGLID